MKIIQSIPAMNRWGAETRKKRQSIGFVPTMGALHEGHLTLIRAAKKKTDRVVVSVFVNPAQFGPREDFLKYPRTLREDKFLCRKEGVAVVFIPTVKTMYPNGFQTRIQVGPLGNILEGASRPGHFDGVATIVSKLFQIVRPHVAFFGQKDYQQTLVIKKLVSDLGLPVRITVKPTVREKDGLALSSRNRYLSPSEREAAGVLYSALKKGRERILAGEKSGTTIRGIMTRKVRKEPRARLDYAAVADPRTLKEVKRIQGRTILLIAAKIGKTRLIDNQLVRL